MSGAAILGALQAAPAILGGIQSGFQVLGQLKDIGKQVYSAVRGIFSGDWGMVQKQNFAPQTYNQPQFNLDNRSSPFQVNGFNQSYSQGALKPTIRKSTFKDFKNQGGSNIQSFQRLNYDLPKQTIDSLQPFQNTYQNRVRQQVQQRPIEQLQNKRIHYNNPINIQQPIIQSNDQQSMVGPSRNYSQNDYTTMENESDMDIEE